MEASPMLKNFAIGISALMHGMAHNIKFEMCRGTKTVCFVGRDRRLIGWNRGMCMPMECLARVFD